MDIKNCIIRQLGKTDMYVCWSDKQAREKCLYLEKNVTCTHPDKKLFTTNTTVS